MPISPFECFYKCFFLIPASAMTVGTLHIPSGGTAVVLYMPPLPLVFPPSHCILCSAVRASSLRCAHTTTSRWGSVRSCPTLTSPLTFQLHLQSGSHPNTHIMLWSFWGEEVPARCLWVLTSARWGSWGRDAVSVIWEAAQSHEEHEPWAWSAL